MFYPLLLLSLQLQRTAAEDIVPLLDTANGNLTLLHETFVVGFANSPSYRGTTDILWACTLTIVSCIYTCIHTHIPPHGTSVIQRVIAKLRWALSALVAPEMVLCAAVRQFLAAQSLIKRLNDLVISEPKPLDLEGHDVPVEHRFSLSYGFFIVMGGISVSTEHLHPTNDRITLTCKGVELLAKKGRFIKISDDEIAARSKANPLGKALVCVQVIWMVVQCSARAANGLPLSLLEIHTMVHVFCAILIYFIWWKKPLDVTVPWTVDSSSFDEILALIMMCTHSKDELYDAEIENLILWRSPLLQDSGDSVEGEERPNQNLAEVISEHAPGEPRQLKLNTSMVIQQGERLSSGIQWSPKPGKPITLTAKDCKRWLLFSNALCRNQALKEYIYPLDLSGVRFKKGHETVTTDIWFEVLTGRCGQYRGITDSISSALLDTIGLFDNLEYSLIRRFVRLLTFHILELSSIVLAFLFPVCYGGVHFAARNFAFPTNTESLLWQIACIGIMVYMPCMIVVWELVVRPAFGDKFIVTAIGLTFHIAIMGFYVLARAYLVLEAFISLRKASLGVFATIPWLQSIPHI